MIRPAKFFDTIRIVELLEKAHAQSKYVGVAEFSHKAAHKLIHQCIHRHGHTHEGGALVMVAVRDQRVEGFMVGILDRVYHVTDKLAANDVFLYCSDKAHPADFIKLFDAYVSWASNNPKVVEIKASWTDVLPDAERVSALYERKGFRRCGGIYERAVKHEDMARKSLAILEVGK